MSNSTDLSGLHCNDPGLLAVYNGLASRARPDGQGAIYALVSPHSGAGTSHIARQLALIAAANTGSGSQILLVDMDVQKNAQSLWFNTPSAQSKYGRAEGPYDASFGAQPFWRVSPTMLNENGEGLSDSNYVSLHLLQGLPLAYTQFHWEEFRQGQSVHIQNARAYWHALRSRFDKVFIDLPAMDRANILSTVAPEADSSILVCGTQNQNSPDLKTAAQSLTACGARCSGVILNDGPAPMGHYGAGA